MLSITNTMPEAYAKIKGNGKYPNLKGKVSFYGVYGGTIVVAEITGFPQKSKNGKINDTFHGFYIHEEDFSPILANHGVVFNAFYTGQFYPEDVIGRTIIVYENSDDFRILTSEDSGEMIACGKIVGE